MLRKVVAAGMCMVMMGMMLAGCGKQAEQAGEKSAGKEVVLKVFDAHAYGLEEYADMAAQFEKEHPGVKIEVQHAANDYDTLLQSRVNSGDIPDVFDVESGTKAQKYYEYAYDWSQDQEILDRFRPDALATGQDESGKTMSLPWTYENMGLLYNKDLFAKAQITQLPQTMDELEEACKKLKAANITPFALAGKESWVLGQITTHFTMDKTLDAKGVVEKLKSGELTIDKLPNFQNFFRFMDLAIKYGQDKPLETDFETSENMLANNQAAIIHMGDWCQSTLDSFNPDANLGFLPFPVSDKKEDTTLLSSCNWTYLVNKDSENLELAKEYCAYILSSQVGQKWICEGVGAVPAAKTQLEVKGKLANDAKQYVEAGKTNGWIHTIGPNAYVETIGPMIQGYIAGDMTAAEVTKSIGELWQS